VSCLPCERIGPAACHFDAFAVLPSLPIVGHKPSTHGKVYPAFAPEFSSIPNILGGNELAAMLIASSVGLPRHTLRVYSTGSRTETGSPHSSQRKI
jgi:hypothetical protein